MSTSYVFLGVAIERELKVRSPQNRYQSLNVGGQNGCHQGSPYVTQLGLRRSREFYFDEGSRILRTFSAYMSTKAWVSLGVKWCRSQRTQIVNSRR